MLMKCLEKKIDGNNGRMLYAVLNKSWRQNPTKQLYGHLPPILQTIQERHVRHSWRSKDKIISHVLWTPTHGHTSVD